MPAEKSPPKAGDCRAAESRFRLASAVLARANNAFAKPTRSPRTGRPRSPAYVTKLCNIMMALIRAQWAHPPWRGAAHDLRRRFGAQSPTRDAQIPRIGGCANPQHARRHIFRAKVAPSAAVGL